MPFDPKTAKAFDPQTAKPFDPGSAKPVTMAQPEPTYGERVDVVTNAARERMLRALAAVPGDPLHGLGTAAPELANAAAQGFGSLFAPATELPGVAGTVAKGVLGAPYSLASFLTNAAVEGLRKQANIAGVPQLVKAIVPYSAYPSPQTREAVRNSYQELASNAGTALLGMGAERGVKSIGPALEQRGLSQATKEIQRVAPPLRKELGAVEARARALPYIAEQQRITPIEKATGKSQFRQALDISRAALDNLWTKKIEPIVNNHPEVQIDGQTQIGQRIAALAEDPYIQKIEPGRAEQIRSYAGNFNQAIDLKTAQNFLKGLNADLKSYYKMTPSEQAAIDAKGVPMAAKQVAADALRDAMAQGLESVGEKSIRGLRRDYGALAGLRDAIQRNVVAAEQEGVQPMWRGWRSTPLWGGVVGEAIATHMGLPPGLSLAGGIATGGLIEGVKLRNMKNATIQRAFERLAKSNIAPPDVTSTRPNIRGLLPQASQRMGGPTENQTTVTTGQYPIPTPRFQEQRLLGRGSVPLGVGGESKLNVTTGQYAVPVTSLPNLKNTQSAMAYGKSGLNQATLQALATRRETFLRLAGELDRRAKEAKDLKQRRSLATSAIGAATRAQLDREAIEAASETQ